ncbi:MAG TPA: acetate kinase, partial [Ramlibacter sp.]|nr:acetate kinase [Ramlibacter sp.]
MSSETILVLNCGSSSIKFALFDALVRPLPRDPLWSGKVEGTGQDALRAVRACVEQRTDGRLPAAIAHRVVHGGTRSAPVRIDRNVLADLRSYIPLAPLHQPYALQAIEALLAQAPQVPQIACFDTAFHRTLPPVEQMFPLPHELWERGVRRYGFHGLSYEYMAAALPERHGAVAHGRTIVAHLGSGASLCAMHELRSVATTMGFSALDGLMMGTRCGSVDAGVLLHLMEVEKLSLKQLTQLLYRESGLLGVSGVSSSPQELLAVERTNQRAHAALQLYVRRIVREIGSLAAVLGGLDMLVFTAGVGEHSAPMRER